MEINKSTLMWIVIVVLILAVIFLTFKVTTIEKAGATGNAIDTTGWTENEIMNYEMHGTIPARVQGGASSGSGMVGGC